MYIRQQYTYMYLPALADIYKYSQIKIPLRQSKKPRNPLVPHPLPLIYLNIYIFFNDVYKQMKPPPPQKEAVK